MASQRTYKFLGGFIIALGLVIAIATMLKSNLILPSTIFYIYAAFCIVCGLGTCYHLHQLNWFNHRSGKILTKSEQFFVKIGWKVENFCIISPLIFFMVVRVHFIGIVLYALYYLFVHSILK